MSDIFEVVADPTRRGILQLLRDRLAGATAEVGVAEFVEALGVTRQSVNRHLLVLKDAGLVTVREDGQQRWYLLDTAPFADLEEWLGQFIGLAQDAVTTSSGAFSAWSGADVGETIGRTVAERSYKARSVIRDASAKLPKRAKKSL